MIINKITTGIVIQQYDTEQGRFVGQEFWTGDKVWYECEDGSTHENIDEVVDDYLAFEMVQPV